ncbi:MAG TPA: hypothetical protein V6D11_15840 [Waterburya sp.]|jgi:hypothetical protein
MSSINLLAISNPSDYWRAGYITVPWQPIYQQVQILPKELVLSDLRDRTHTPLIAQVDRVDPDDPAHDTLIFSLAHAIPPGSDDDSMISAFVRADRGQPMPDGLGEPSLEVVYGLDGRERGVRLVNNRLIIWFNLVCAPENDERNWYAGSATSIQLDRQELLDPVHAVKGEWMSQDPEKRCMQVDRLQLPGLEPRAPYYQVSLFNHSYRLVAQSNGPVRASITVASEPFEYIGSDPTTGENCHLMCQLYRVISLYAGADYVSEELFVKGKPINDKGEESAAGKTVNLNFVAHYFTHIHMEHQADIYQPPHVPGWFAVGSSAPLHLGYGFASDVHIDSVAYPHEGDENRFSWQLLPGKLAKCLHLFMRGETEGFEARPGRYWYEFIYKPLKVEVYKEAFVSQLIREDSLLTV